MDQNEFVQVNDLPQKAPETAAPQITVPDEARHGKKDGGSWDAIEREMILEAMKKAKGNRTQTARNLGWGRTTLWRKMNRYGIN